MEKYATKIISLPLTRFQYAMGRAMVEEYSLMNLPKGRPRLQFITYLLRHLLSGPLHIKGREIWIHLRRNAVYLSNNIWEDPHSIFPLAPGMLDLSWSPPSCLDELTMTYPIPLLYQDSQWWIYPEDVHSLQILPHAWTYPTAVSLIDKLPDYPAQMHYLNFPIGFFRPNTSFEIIVSYHAQAKGGEMNHPIVWFCSIKQLGARSHPSCEWIIGPLHGSYENFPNNLVFQKGLTLPQKFRLGSQHGYGAVHTLATTSPDASRLGHAISLSFPPHEEGEESLPSLSLRTYATTGEPGKGDIASRFHALNY